MTIFVKKTFTGHSGGILHWKIEGDGFTSEDWACLAYIAATELPPFGEVIGIPRGGIPFAEALKPYAWVEDHDKSLLLPRLIADDVTTTGGSLLEYMTQPTDIGVVAFNRSPDKPLPPRVHALFTKTKDPEFR